MSDIEIAMPARSEPAKVGTAKKEHSDKRATPWRDNIEAMLMAIVMALVLKYFIVEAYRIPTGSMQPTLMGNAKTGVFDRILVDKFTPVLRDPVRFETWVFRYPLDGSKNFVKRVVGIGPEEFRVHNGDLWRRDLGYTDAADILNKGWKVLRRPRRVQEETWLALIREDAGDPLFFSSEDHSVVASRSVDHKGDFRMRYGSSRASVMDRYNDGYPDALKNQIQGGGRGSGSHPVGDLRVSGEVTPGADCEWIKVQIQEGNMSYELTIPGPAAPEGAKPTVSAEDTRPSYTDFPFSSSIEGDALRLQAGNSYTFGAQNLDDLLELEIDGLVLCSLEIPTASNQSSGLHVENKGAASFDELMVYRDIFYTPGDVETWTIPEGHFFMMGDNTLDSSDSRMWKKYRLNRLAEDGEVKLVEGNARSNGHSGQSDFDSDMNPYISSMSTPDLRPITWFRDTYGELHPFEADEIENAAPLTVPAPFVPRDKMLGRAVSVFWPIKPFDDVWRFKWVH